MEDFLLKTLAEILETGPISKPILIAGTALWSGIFLLTGLAIGRAACKVGRSAVLQVEEENAQDLIRVEHYRTEIDIQTYSPVLRKSDKPEF